MISELDMMAPAALMITLCLCCGWPVVYISTALRTRCLCEVEPCMAIDQSQNFLVVSSKDSLADMLELGLASCLLLSWTFLSYQMTHYMLFPLFLVSPLHQLLPGWFAGWHVGSSTCYWIYAGILVNYPVLGCSFLWVCKANPLIMGVTFLF